MYIDCTGTGRLKPRRCRTSAATRGERENSRNTGSRACRAATARAQVFPYNHTQYCSKVLWPQGTPSVYYVYRQAKTQQAWLSRDAQHQAPTVTDLVYGQRLGLPQAAPRVKRLLLKEEGHVARAVQEVLVRLARLRRH